MFKALAKKKEFVVLLIVIALAIVVTIVNPAFLRPNNIFDFLRSNAMYGIMAFGMLPILITGGIDLSVSSTICLCAVLQGVYLQHTTNHSIILIFLICIAAGGAVGLINGLLITKLKIPPIVATLGTQTITLAAVLFATKGKWMSDLSEKYKAFGDWKLIRVMTERGETGLYTQVILMIIIGIITWFILKNMLIGRGIYAVGGNMQSAQRVGYNVDKILIFTYIYCGILAGLASISSVSIVNSVDPNGFSGYEMTVIAIVVLGGASLAGGIGTILGTWIGIILMAVLKNGLILMHVSGYWQQAIMGAIIVVTIAIDAISQTREADRAIKVDVEE